MLLILLRLYTVIYYFLLFNWRFPRIFLHDASSSIPNLFVIGQSLSTSLRKSIWGWNIGCNISSCISYRNASYFVENHGHFRRFRRWAALVWLCDGVFNFFCSVHCNAGRFRRRVGQLTWLMLEVNQNLGTIFFHFYGFYLFKLFF